MSHPAGLPAELAGWSRRVEALDTEGEHRSWHLLDTHAGYDVPAGTPTLVCVHGNPTWSYLWRRFLASAPAGWRVIAIDQLGMGWSDRLPAPRTLAMRIDDLDTVVSMLGVDGPVTIAAHDWGGPISLGWALRLVDSGEAARLHGIVLGNTAVHQPASFAAPALIRLARSRLLRESVTVDTPVFVRGATALSRPALPKNVRGAFATPYRSAFRRRSVGGFVADIPFETDHPSRSVLDGIASGLDRLTDVPVLLLWGARDPVFTERHLADLLRRLPHADVQRYPRASHLVFEDAPDTVATAWSWIGQTRSRGNVPASEAAPEPGPEASPTCPLWAALDDRSADSDAAVVELGTDGSRRSVSFAELGRRVDELAAGLSASGVRPGDRVGLLIPPGIELTAVVYACWRAGASVVVSDAGLGLRSLGNALRSAGPDHLIGIAPALLAARALRIPGRRILTGRLDRTGRRTERLVRLALPKVPTLDDVAHRSPPRTPCSGCDEEDNVRRGSQGGAGREAAVLFTSGATGPPKGVVYTFAQLDAQLAQVRALCDLGPADRLVAAFAPFALYGPALGVGAVVPAMDVTQPATLTARALADAVTAIEATVVFASPAALANVVATAADLDRPGRTALGRVRAVLSAGAPVRAGLLTALQDLLPGAELHTPYGMTEVLPVTDVTAAEILVAGPGPGVLVGRPRPGVDVALAPLRPEPTGSEVATADELTQDPGVTGEICVRAAHVKTRYDKLWAAEARSSRTPGWHRTGDVGRLDDQGRLWVEGRLAHVVRTAAGPLTPVAAEQRVETLDGVGSAALVGVGPIGTQQPVVVLTTLTGRRDGSALAGPESASRIRRAVRDATRADVAAVLVTDALPTDIRHNSKIDRLRVARWAERVLAGGRTGRP